MQPTYIQLDVHGSQILFCRAAPRLYLLHGALSFLVQDFVEFHKVPISLFLQHLRGSFTVTATSQSLVISVNLILFCIFAKVPNDP